MSGSIQLPDPDAPYALRDPAERARRRTMLALPHMVPLVEYVAGIRRDRGLNAEVPDADPRDGGVNARALFLQQDPGAKAVDTRGTGGSGFISRNNPDQTAYNMCCLQLQAGIARADTLLWNIVPWRVPKDEQRSLSRHIGEAMPYLSTLVGLLPRLEVVILVGKRAQSRAADIVGMVQVPIVFSPHTSPLNLNSRQDARARVLAAFRAAAKILYQSQGPRATEQSE